MARVAAYPAREEICTAIELNGLNKTAVKYSKSKTWYDFEQDVMAVHIKYGWKILNQAVSGKGDGGIDTLAQKNTPIGAQYILVQSKKWSAPVGPSVVREMIGSLEDFKKEQSVNAQAAIYTTSFFTSEAIQLASRHAIELIDGDYWSTLVVDT